MIAMQYTIRLARDFSVQRIRERVEARHCLFDDLPGLIHKTFLFNEREGLYAPFYVWECNTPARDFLTGPLFQGLVANFGRPRVRCWSILEFKDMSPSACVEKALKEVDSIAAEEDLGALKSREREIHRTMLEKPGLGCHLVGLDPDRWELMRYSTWTAGAMPAESDVDLREVYDVLHLSRPVVSA
jgi:hypothetical protein